MASYFDIQLAEVKSEVKSKGYVRALRQIANLRSSITEGTHKDSLDKAQSEILVLLSRETCNLNLRFTFLLGSLGYGIDKSPLCLADTLFELGGMSRSTFYLKESLIEANKALESNLPKKDKERMERMLRTGKVLLELAPLLKADDAITIFNPRNFPNLPLVDVAELEVLKRYWKGLSDRDKKSLLKIPISSLEDFLQNSDGVKEAFKKCLNWAERRGSWIMYLCRSCSRRFSDPDSVKKHIEAEHACVNGCLIPQRLSQDWIGLMSSGHWEPLDFSDGNLSLARDGIGFVERRELLQQLKLKLSLLVRREVFPSTLRHWLLQFVKETHPTVPVELLTAPQSLCILHPNHIRQVLNSVNNLTHQSPGIPLLSNVVDYFWKDTLSTDFLSFDSTAPNLLINKSLLLGKVQELDNHGKVKRCNPVTHFDQLRPRGDYIISWINFCSSGNEEGFEIPVPISAHDLDVWLAVLGSLQFTCQMMEARNCNQMGTVEKDAEILLLDVSRRKLVEELVRLSFFDMRYYLEKPIKTYLMHALNNNRIHGQGFHVFH